MGINQGGGVGQSLEATALTPRPPLLFAKWAQKKFHGQ